MIEVKNRIYAYSSDIEAFFQDFKDFFEGETIEETTEQVKIILDSMDITIGLIKNSAQLSITLVHKSTPSTNVIGLSYSYIGVYFIKTSKIKGVIFGQANSSTIFLPNSNNYFAAFIGNSTNKITQSQTTSVFINNTQSNTYSSCISNIDNVSKKIVPTVFSNLSYNLSGDITVIQKAWSKYSPYVMDNIYYLCSSNLTSLSLGECSLGDKNFYMFGSMLLED